MAKMKWKAREAREGGCRQEVRLVRLKKKRTLKKWFVFVFQKSLHFEVSSEDIMICIYLEVLEQCQSTFPVSPAVTLTGKGSKQQEKRVQAELC